eukprot:Selendium_serpulae@DN5999_c1_g1_i1.p1
MSFIKTTNSTQQNAMRTRKGETKRKTEFQFQREAEHHSSAKNRIDRPTDRPTDSSFASSIHNQQKTLIKSIQLVRSGVAVGNRPCSVGQNQNQNMTLTPPKKRSHDDNSDTLSAMPTPQ